MSRQNIKKVILDKKKQEFHKQDLCNKKRPANRELYLAVFFLLLPINANCKKWNSSKDNKKI